MSSSDNVASATLAASAEQQDELKELWKMMLDSINEGKPCVLLSQSTFMAMGEAEVVEVAKRFGSVIPLLNTAGYLHFNHSISIKTDVTIEYNQDLDALSIAPRKYQPAGQTSLLATVLYVTLPDVEDKPMGPIPNRGEKISKPRNSWILYRQYKNPKVTEANPGMHCSGICKLPSTIAMSSFLTFLAGIISQMWRTETADVKAHFKALAEQEKQQLLEQHPDWKCSPRKSSEIKRRKSPSKQIALQTNSSIATPAGVLPGYDTALTGTLYKDSAATTPNSGAVQAATTAQTLPHSASFGMSSQMAQAAAPVNQVLPPHILATQMVYLPFFEPSETDMPHLPILDNSMTPVPLTTRDNEFVATRIWNPTINNIARGNLGLTDRRYI